MHLLSPIILFALISGIQPDKTSKNEDHKAYQSLFHPVDYMPAWKSLDMLNVLQDKIAQTPGPSLTPDEIDEVKRVKETTIIDVGRCDLRDLEKNWNVERHYARNHYRTMMDLIGLANRYQLNICLRELDQKWLDRMLGLPHDLLVRAFEIMRESNPLMPDQTIVSGPDLPIKRKFTDKAALVAFYLKHHVEGIERKNFNSDQEHQSQVRAAHESIKQQVCEPTHSMIMSEYSTFYNLKGLMPEYSHIDLSYLWRRLNFMCYDPVDDDRIYSIFMELFDSIEMQEKRIHELTAGEIQEFLFATQRPNLRTGSTLELLNRLLELSGSENEAEAEILGRLVALDEISDSQCDHESLSNRLELQNRFDESYVNLHPYVATMNNLQVEICYQSICADAAKLPLTIPLEQLARLYRIRHHYLIVAQAKRPITDFGIGPEKSAELDKGIAKYASEAKGSQTNDLLRAACKDIYRTMERAVTRFDTLKALGIKNRVDFGRQTAEAISFGKLCAAKGLIDNDSPITEPENSPWYRKVWPWGKKEK